MAINPTQNSNDQSPSSDNSSAANLIRAKVEQIYSEEPSAQDELSEAAGPKRSKHQQFMYELGNSGKDLAAIQTEWHNYYQGLTPEEKHQVWQEFYASQPMLSHQRQAQNVKAQKLSAHKHEAAKSKSRYPKSTGVHGAKGIQQKVKNKVTADGKLGAKQHLQSLLFGLGLGLIVVIIFLFGFFNEVIISPFIQPSRSATATPLIVDNNNTASTKGPEVIIPKINVEIPVNYSETSTDESAIENDLQDGVVHYPTTTLPGQQGNTAFFGHSSNNIFNKGKYKFAFVLLHTLTEGDVFYLSYNGKLYVYKVISRNIVDPSDVAVLNAVAGQSATATLITCDPPGTSLHRLVVVGQQISPDPSSDTQATTSVSNTTEPASLPGNGPTLFGKYIKTLPGKIVTVVVLSTLLLWGILRLIRRYPAT
ncbi:MAG TPA: class E sortase [Candidatus Saccharimonadales bacterium]|nr:class E sortase [Candidatus Saccharimonadales bacterium]